MSRLRKGGGVLATTAIVIAVVAQAAGAVVAPKADYRFHDERTSSVPGAPELTDLGGGNAFATENVAGCRSRALTFPQDGGLNLDASGLRSGPPFSQTIVLDFRLADVSGYRRLIQGADSTSDTGLYIHNGSLVWYEAGDHGTPTTTIAPNQFVEVTLLQSAILSQFSMSGFVNGVEQASFTGPTEIGPQVRLFRDNGPPGTTGEASAGSVFRVRYYPSGFSTGDAQTIYADGLLGNPASCPGAGATATGKPRAMKNSYGVGVDTGVLASCPDTGVECTGTASVSGPGAKKSKKGSTLGSTTFTLTSGKSQTINLNLGKRGTKLLGKRGKLKVVASVGVTGPNGKTVTAQTGGKIKGSKTHR